MVDMANLTVYSEYQEPDRVRMGNETGLLIHSTGAFLLCSPTSSFVLKNLLHVPDITKKFMSISQFKANNKFLEFTLSLVCQGSLYVKNSTTGIT